MQNEDLLRELGWSEDLIAEVSRVAAVIRDVAVPAPLGVYALPKSGSSSATRFQTYRQLESAADTLVPSSQKR